MKRIIDGIGKNSPQEYDKLFFKPHDWSDVRRWETLLKYYRGGKIVDIGCLNSLIPDMVSTKRDYAYLGTDTSIGAIKEMRRSYHSDFKFVVDDIYHSKIKDEIADYLVLGEVLEHLENPGLALKEALRILKPGGILAISVPLDEAKEPGAVDGERHLWSFDKEDFKNLLQGHKLKFKVLRSKWFPYKYQWPNLIVWATK